MCLCAVSVWKDLLVFGLVVCMNKAVTVQELRHDVGLQGHVERRACLLALKQVWVVTHLHAQANTDSVFRKKKDTSAPHAPACSQTANSSFNCISQILLPLIKHSAIITFGTSCSPP